MRQGQYFVLLLLSLVALSSGCRSMSYGDRGSLLGGLVGAGTGAAIGDASGNAGVGALIGTAAGALAGGAIGDNIDSDVARNRAEVEARMGRQMASAVTPQDVVAMTQAGLSEGVIVTHIRAHGVAQPPQVNDLINLRNQGVSDGVIQALQSSPGPQPMQGYAAAPQPLVIAEPVYPPYYGPYYGPPPPYWYGRRAWGPGPCGPRRGVSWGFSVQR